MDIFTIDSTVNIEHLEQIIWLGPPMDGSRSDINIIISPDLCVYFGFLSKNDASSFFVDTRCNRKELKTYLS